jgi:hypothetical protein
MDFAQERAAELADGAATTASVSPADGIRRRRWEA